MAMRRLIVGSMIAFGLVWPLTASADQKDPRLDELFAVLQTSSDASALTTAHGQIWEIWTGHEDPELLSLMKKGIVLMRRQRLDDALRVFDGLVDIAPD